MDWIIPVALCFLAALVAGWKDFQNWLTNNLNWTVGVSVLLALTALGLIVNNNVTTSPESVLTDWTAWFASVVALVVAVFGIVDAVPKIATAVEKKAEARKTEAEALLLAALARILETEAGGS